MRKKILIVIIIWVIIACVIVTLYLSRGVSLVKEFLDWALNIWPILVVLGGGAVGLSGWVIKHDFRAKTEKQIQQTNKDIIQNIFVIESGGYEVGSPSIEGYPQSKVRRIARIDVLIQAIPSQWVNSVQLKLLNNYIGTDWNPDYTAVGGATGGYYYFDIPDSVKQGKYLVRLIAIATDKTTESEPFEIEVPA